MFEDDADFKKLTPRGVMVALCVLLFIIFIGVIVIRGEIAYPTSQRIRDAEKAEIKRYREIWLELEAEDGKITDNIEESVMKYYRDKKQEKIDYLRRQGCP